MGLGTRVGGERERSLANGNRAVLPVGSGLRQLWVSGFVGRVHRSIVPVLDDGVLRGKR